MTVNTTTTSFLRQVQQLQQTIQDLQDQIDTGYDQIARVDTSRADSMRSLIAAAKRSMTVLQRSGTEMAQHIVALNGLAETTSMINSSLDPREVVNGVVDAIVDLTGAERAYIVLVEGESLQTYAARNWDNESVTEVEVTFSRSIIQATLKEGKPIVTTNAQLDERFQNVASIEFKAVRAVMCVPLISRGQTIGVVYADNRLALGIFNADTVELIGSFANQAALAIENARRFVQVKNDLQDAENRLTNLRIQIDEAKLDSTLKDIVESDYFQKLRGMVQQSRERRERTNE